MGPEYNTLSNIVNVTGTVMGTGILLDNNWGKENLWQFCIQNIFCQDIILTRISAIFVFFASPKKENSRK
jgi:hypothetical protein